MEGSIFRTVWCRCGAGVQRGAFLNLQGGAPRPFRSRELQQMLWVLCPIALAPRK